MWSITAAKYNPEPVDEDQASQSLVGSWDFGCNKCSVTNWMPKLILFDRTSPTCCLKTGFRRAVPLLCKADWEQFHEGLCRNHARHLPRAASASLLAGTALPRACALVQGVKSSGLNSIIRCLGAVLCIVHLLSLQDLLLASLLGESPLGKPWFCCFIRTRSFSDLLLNSYPKLSQFQPINLLISFPSPCGTPGKGKCHTFDVVWICVLHRWGRHLETFFSANTQEQWRLQLGYWGWDKRSSPQEVNRDLTCSCHVVMLEFLPVLGKCLIFQSPKQLHDGLPTPVLLHCLITFCPLQWFWYPAALPWFGTALEHPTWSCACCPFLSCPFLPFQVTWICRESTESFRFLKKNGVRSLRWFETKEIGEKTTPPEIFFWDGISSACCWCLLMEGVKTKYFFFICVLNAQIVSKCSI